VASRKFVRSTAQWIGASEDLSPAVGFWSHHCERFRILLHRWQAVSVATAPVEAGLFEQIVIRTNKGDRLRWLPVSNPKKQPPDVDEFGLPAEENLRLPEGCDSSVSPVANARAARVASYCVS
jgi:hypothetical protein